MAAGTEISCMHIIIPQNWQLSLVTCRYKIDSFLHNFNNTKIWLSSKVTRKQKIYNIIYNGNKLKKKKGNPAQVSSKTWSHSEETHTQFGTHVYTHTHQHEQCTLDIWGGGVPS